MDAFILAFETLNYRRAENSHLQKQVQKIAILAIDGIPEHVARQLRDGRWASKLGELVDIQHNTLEEIEGDEYGFVTIVMERRRLGPDPAPPTAEMTQFAELAFKGPDFT